MYDSRTIHSEEVLHEITEQQRTAISLMSAHEDIDKSEIVRNALDTYIPKKYMQMTKDTHKKQMRDEGTPYIVHIDGTIL